MRSSNITKWFRVEGNVLYIPSVISPKYLSKATKLPVNGILKTCCHKKGKAYWYRHNRVHYEFMNKSQIVFPYKYAVNKLKSHIDYKTNILDIEPEPINLDEYSSLTEYNEHLNKKQCVISVMGHVDHGKTTLLDTIRTTNIAENESGLITQRVSCYHYNLSSTNWITFIDTPGHEIFFKMRSNSVIVADSVILVIDILEGVQKQTIEVIKKAKQLCIPLLLVLNKIDKLFEYKQLNQIEISRNLQNIIDSTTPSEDNDKLTSIINNIQFQLKDILKTDDDESLAFDIVPISAKYNVNIDQMLLSLNTLCNAIQLMSPRDISPQAIVLEASSDKTGSYLMLIIHAGVLEKGMIIVGGYVAGKITRIQDPTNDYNLKAVYPGMAAKCYISRFSDISRYDGVNQLPKSGEVMFVMEKDSAAQLLEYRMMIDQLERAIDINKSDMKYVNKQDKIDDDNINVDIMESMDKLDDYIPKDDDATKQTTYNSLEETHLDDMLFDDDQLMEIEEKMDRVNELNKGIILRCDTQGTLNVLKQIIYQSQLNKNNVDKVKIVESGLGNITVGDLEIQEQINSKENDECRIYMFNVDLSNSAKKMYQELMKEEYNTKDITKRKAIGLYETDLTIRRFDVFSDLQHDVYEWLGYKDAPIRDLPIENTKYDI